MGKKKWKRIAKQNSLLLRGYKGMLDYYRRELAQARTEVELLDAAGLYWVEEAGQAARWSAAWKASAKGWRVDAKNAERSRIGWFEKWRQEFGRAEGSYRWAKVWKAAARYYRKEAKIARTNLRLSRDNCAIFEQERDLWKHRKAKAEKERDNFHDAMDRELEAMKRRAAGWR